MCESNFTVHEFIFMSVFDVLLFAIEFDILKVEWGEKVTKVHILSSDLPETLTFSQVTNWKLNILR